MADNVHDHSIIAAEGAIANVLGMTQMTPPIKDLCESLLGGSCAMYQCA